MLEWFRSGGIMMWPIVACGVLCVVSLVRALRTGRGGAAMLTPRTLLRDGVLFWGAVAALLGVLGTLVGLAQIGRYVQQAGSITSPIAWGGVRVALTTTIFGTLVLLFALGGWAVLARRMDGTAAVSDRATG